MAVARTRCVAIVGVSGHVIEVECHISNGLPGLHLIGLLDTALNEARDRVRSAVMNSKYGWPDSRITISLFPASLPKRGSQFDLAIAVSLLGAANVIPIERIAEPFFLGELGLDGRLRPVRGILPAVAAAGDAGATKVVVPAANAEEAALVPGVTVLPVGDLRTLVEWLRGPDHDRVPPPGLFGPSADPDDAPPAAAQNGQATASVPDLARPAPDLRDVAGQPLARKALEVCAAGGHNLWMLGPPGTGKTMLAERLPSLLPPLSLDHALEVTAIHSIAGTLPAGRPLLDRAPFVNPHHTATVAAIVGGGTGVPRPGAVSLAHRGVLFLDEAPEFPMAVLDSLRQPLESGTVTVARASGSVTFPARFMLVMAANPCPCAEASDACQCTPTIRRRYLARLSGPLLDRIDVKVAVARSTRTELLADRRFAEPSAVVAERVLAARERAAKRLAPTPWRVNSELPASALHGEFRPSPAAMKPLTTCLDNGALSARGLDRIVRVAWTLADLAAKDQPEVEETSAALAMWLGVGA
ncbi:magnesium chelatase family protein [Thermocatellispora tengchongensis]|uniref:Magnesium chelatase family protein n=1 Tax=Thermocatellispora tengchongensis TaxID=1073253 RepID=A0A840PK25_9ACTN|nr:YifB family Mg chelatase-like AAA ATPase [Thermocatellispora tengchongensis]MBB5138273.1 magnesium chelatase family protein [Thermocatellispora tengchongensis]